MRFVRPIKILIMDIYQKINFFRKGYRDKFSFPFDVNKPMPQGADKVMKKCCDALKIMNIRYFVTDGTALGLYRNGSFIPHDNDIDVAIIGDYDVKMIHEYFTRKLKMSLGRRLFYKGKVQQLIYYTSDEIIFDMVFWTKEDDGYCYVRFPECEYPCKLDYKYFESESIYEFFGTQYPLHAHIEDWLKDRYGNDWMIPKTEKGDWRDDSNYFDKEKL